uniref:LIM zinc-binding domain-containing protein n=1 Tax=Branchiostoma floridae TaxID=7739 RepID=C3ZYB2_BRAFL|eukprot:XP_002586458.1 hypothetical protein BRAFLDRAFT_131557 [Branchiostoma floridae]
MTDTKWEEELLTCDDCIRVFKSRENGYDIPRLIFCGPRLQMGVSKGRVDSVYHYASGHMGYRGTEVYRTQGICRLAQGGQILINESLWQDLPKDQIAPYVHREVGSFKLEGFDNLTSLTEPYCEEDFFQYNAPRCRSCSNPITGGFIEAIESTWHPDCFVCQDNGTGMLMEGYMHWLHPNFCRHWELC